MLEAVKEGLWEWPQHVSVSPMAKAFVAGLLVVDPSDRLTCEQALNHCWMQVGDTRLSAALLRRMMYLVSAAVEDVVGAIVEVAFEIEAEHEVAAEGVVKVEGDVEVEDEDDVELAV